MRDKTTWRTAGALALALTFGVGSLLGTGVA